MQIACDKHDKDLLFLAHGLIGTIKGFLLRLHVRKCKECQSRLKEFEMASFVLREAFDGPVRRNVPTRRIAKRHLVLAGLAILLLASAMAAYVYTMPEADEPAPLPCDFPPDLKIGSFKDKIVPM